MNCSLDCVYKIARKFAATSIILVVLVGLSGQTMWFELRASDTTTNVKPPSDKDRRSKYCVKQNSFVLNKTAFKY